ncbi:MAG TPA: hypothetical protein VFE78_12190 [Gemmataceae bacterium]|jgi:hypothetical protein|nr:hypothetical protein [Gemmataceae bacterium]
MIRHHSLGRLRPCLTAVVVCLLPGTAGAEALAFRNECKAPVVVQAVSVFRGRVFRDKPYLLKTGDTTPDIVLPGDKVITVYDAKVPNRVLFQGALPASPNNQAFGIVPDVPPPKVRVEPRKVPGGMPKGP